MHPLPSFLFLAALGLCCLATAFQRRLSVYAGREELPTRKGGRAMNAPVTQLSKCVFGRRPNPLSGHCCLRRLGVSAGEENLSLGRADVQRVHLSPH